MYMTHIGIAAVAADKTVIAGAAIECWNDLRSFNNPKEFLSVDRFGDKVCLIDSAIGKYCLLNVRESGQTQRLCKTCGFSVYGVTGKLAVPLPTYIAARKDGINVTYGVSPRQTLSMSNLNPMVSTVIAINSCCALVACDDKICIHFPKTVLRLFEFQ
ncbi:unnamed protein product [Cylicocyclus nassatus]|uniref:Uncharacterized protein n=1 Tax=Cylicocyclus nassatus TaxID=53992 RepID=A0AA36MC49_CYLNA|nr:unnamed protein product [Cylicocyclus nassatus]